MAGIPTNRALMTSCRPTAGIHLGTSTRRKLQANMRRTELRQLGVFVLGVAMIVTTHASAQTRAHGDGIGRPIYTVQPLRTVTGTAVKNDLSAPQNTVPTWSGTFQYGPAGRPSRVFPYTMVGTSPWLGSATTTVPTQIIPIALIFSNGVTLDGTTKVAPARKWNGAGHCRVSHSQKAVQPE